ncbi:MAG: type IV pilus assembly protein PilM [Phycisphaerae bacterium]
MSLKIVKGDALPMGIDIADGQIKIAQVRMTQEKCELIAAGSASLPVGKDESPRTRKSNIIRAIKSILKSQSFSGKKAVLSLPASASFVRHVRVPKLAPEETADAVKWELDGKLPYSVEEAVIRHVVAGDVYGEGESKQEVIAVAAHRDTVQDYIDIAKKCKLDIVGIDVEACALVECFARLFRRTEDQSRTILFIDLGQDSTQVVLTHGNRMVFARNLDTAGRHLDAAVADGLDISVEQANELRRDLQREQADEQAEGELENILEKPLATLTDELMQCMRYYETVFRNQGVERAIFVGGQAFDKHLCQTIAQRLNLPAQIGDPLVRMELLPGAGSESGLDRRQPQPNWAVAVGLSLSQTVAA